MTFIEASTTYNRFSTPIPLAADACSFGSLAFICATRQKLSATYLKQLLRALEERSSRTVTTQVILLLYTFTSLPATLIYMHCYTFR